ncbi:CRISPR-associated endonuclease Cas1 [uncultured Thiohalocapsa sp.]|uniref:CRISPR-associated endonuclease Cas1 n=1 Tax=uncultured Thiohalocapsa sp. TaxID=768990 RepID=UPI0025D026FD|nr:CRISPR-associated endonuclease Cas1 [uncultured Thiohalocapsa sp.]
MMVSTLYQARPPEPPAHIADDAAPLYIAAGSDTRVRLDRRALSVQREARAEQLFPLQRIARVHSSTLVQWSTEALLACAERGISVVFVHDDGDIAARLLPRPGARDELLHRLQDLMLLPHGLDRYTHWLGMTRARIAHWACSRLGAPDGARDPRNGRAWIEHQAQQYAGGRGAERTRQWLRSLAYQWTAAHLAQLGFGRNTELGQAGEPSLARDLSELLMWYLEPPRIGWLHRRFDAARHRGEPLRLPRHADTVRLFESRAARVSKRGRDITNSLHRWLVSDT